MSDSFPVVVWRILSLLSVLLALVQTGCAHTLSECAACGPGKVCQRTELPGSSIPVTQCFTSCKSDRQCDKGQSCNCDGDACSHHSSSIPLNVCVVGERRRTEEDDSRFTIDSKDRRFCQDCGQGELCVDVGTGGKPDFRCIKQCGRDTDCPAPMLCNCGSEDCSMHSGTTETNICVLPPSDANRPNRGSP